MKKIFLVSLLFPIFLFAQVEGEIKVPYVDFPMKDGKGVYSTRGKCNMCHSFGYVINQGKQSRAFWLEKTVKMIKTFNAPIAEADIEVVVNYLYENYGSNDEHNNSVEVP